MTLGDCCEPIRTFIFYPTSFFIFVFCSGTKMFPVISQQSLDTCSIQKKRCRNGVTCVVLCTLPSMYLVCVVFGTAIPTSFYIFGNCFSYLFAGIFCCTTVPYRRLSFSKLSTNTKFLRARKIRLACEAKYVSWDHTRK